MSDDKFSLDPSKVRGDLGPPVKELMGYRGKQFKDEPREPLIVEPPTLLSLLVKRFGD